MGGADVISPHQMRLYIETPMPASEDKQKDGDEDKQMEGNSPPTDLIPDAATLGDYGINNDAAVYVTFAKSWESGNGVPDGDGWEEIDIV